MAEIDQPDLTTLTVQLLSAYFANNSVPSTELAELIHTIRTALTGLVEPSTPAPPEYIPAVTVRKSMGSPEYILSLIDGRPYKTLKRHLANHGLTPAEYRDRYGLAKDYPMVAPAYSERRRAVAQALGLGQRRSKTLPVEAAAPASEAVAEAPVVVPEPKAAPANKASRTAQAKSVSTVAITGPAPEAATDPVSAAPALRRRGRKASGATSSPDQNDANLVAKSPAKRGSKPAKAVIADASASPSTRARRKTLTIAAAKETPAPARSGRRKEGP